MRFWEAEFLQFLSADLMTRRVGAYDPEREPQQRQLRQRHFFAGLEASAEPPG